MSNDKVKQEESTTCRPLGYIYDRPRGQQWCITHNQPMDRCPSANPVSGEDGVPERAFIKACHPASPNRNCTWSVSKDQKDSVEYVRADLLATVRKEEREAAFKEAIDLVWTVEDHPDYNTLRTDIANALERAALEASKKGEGNG